MIKRFKSFLWVVFLASGLQASWGFALLGPLPGYPGLPTDFGDAWQTAVIGYGLPYYDESSLLTPGGPVFLGDIGGPKNIGEEYRRNARTIYYTYDANFLGFFGTEGATAADGAFAVMNSLTNVTSYSRDLSEFPLNSQQFNYQAQSLFLTDVKSVTLHLLVEQMGLAEPERFSWTLAERIVGAPPGCPLNVSYLVLQRNFDFSPTALNQLQYSSYVNNVLYSYYIVEICVPPPATLAQTIPFAVDPLAQEYTAVAANDGDGFGGVQFSFGGGLQVGGFYTGLTRDDVAGLRYLLQTNNVNWETAATNSLLFTISTNFSTQQLFPNGTGTNATGTNAGFYFFDGTYGYGDLRALIEASITNNPATLQALYPGLLIASSSNYFVIASNATVTSFFANGAIGSPFGTLQLVTVTNYTFFLQERWVYTFANVFTNHYYSQSVSFLQSITVAPNYGSPYPGVPITNTTSQTLVSPNASGDFFVLTLFQTNVCPLNILYIGLTNVTATTNFITSASTNVVTATNTGSFSFSQILVTFFTNYTFVINPVTCSEITNATGLYQGVDNVKFVRANFDSLIGQFFQPITNFYTMVFVTNSQAVRQHFQRVITQPDILLSANNFIAGNTFNGSVSRNINFDVGNILPGLAGPGVINSPTTFNYNKIGDAFRNGTLLEFGYTTNNFLSELNQQPTTAWASFDSSTNDPVVYPNGTSIQNLENQILVQVSPASLPNGTSGVSYPATIFTASGGSFSPPFTWSATGLPSGLTLSSGGTLSGTPMQTGTFDIIIQLNDSLTPPRTVRWNYTITIQ